MAHLHQTRHNSKAAFIRAGLAFVCLFTFAAAGIESAPVSLDDIRWKKFQPSSEVYIDTTLQFTPAVDSIPDVDVTKDKLALWLSVDTSGAAPVTNLCVYSSRADLKAVAAPRTGGIRLGGAQGAVTSMTPHVFRLRGTETIQPGRWYRLTVRTIKDITRRAAKTANPARALLGFQIYLDGALLTADRPSFSTAYTSYAAGTEGWLDAVKEADLLAFLRSGTVFVSLCGESADAAVGSVGFRGDGEVDGMDVSAAVPESLGVSSLDFTLSLPASESVVRALLGE